MSCLCVLQNTAVVGGFQPQVCAPTRSIKGRDHSIIGLMSFHVLCSSESCHDGHHAASGVSLSALDGQEYSSYVQRLCALQGPVPTGNMQPYVCHIIYASPSMDRNTQSYTQYHTMCVLFQNPVAMGGIQPQVRGSTQSLDGQEQSNNMSCSCAFSSRAPP